MVIISTSATEVSIQAASPELPTHFSVTVDEQAGGAAAAAGAAGAGVAAGAAGAEAAGVGVASAAGAEAAGVAVESSAHDGAGAAKPIRAAIASADANPMTNRDSFIA
jgi:hypothetical protein